MDQSPEQIEEDARLEHFLRGIRNDMELASRIRMTRERAILFNNEISGPLFKLRKKFDMPCANVVKVKPNR